MVSVEFEFISKEYIKIILYLLVVGEETMGEDVVDYVGSC